MKITNFGSLPEAPGFTWLEFSVIINGFDFNAGIWFPVSWLYDKQLLDQHAQWFHESFITKHQN